MFKRIAIVLIVVLLFLLTSCSKVPSAAVIDGILDIEKYISSLSAKKTAPFEKQADLLMHPLKDAIALYGDDYEFICQGSYAQLDFHKANCSFEVHIGAAYETYTGNMDVDDYDIMEYLAFAQIEKVVFSNKGTALTDGITIGMSEQEISKKLGVDGLNYQEVGTIMSIEHDENGKEVNVYYITGRISDVDCAVVFTGDILSRVEITKSSSYLTEGKENSDHNKQMIDEAFSFVSKNGLATFHSSQLSYKGIIYSSHYDSYFYSWQFDEGNYKDYEICVEQASPNRIYVASPMGMPFVFWCDGQYVDPMLSFLGKWREHADKEYIDIKSISKEGIVVFDMYVHQDINTGDMVLLKNLSVAIGEIPRTLDDYLFAEYMDEALDGDAQLYDGNVQSGYYGYAGDKYYLIDSLLLNLNGSVQYLPRGLGGRVGAGPLSLHIPSENPKYTQPSTWGYMENFGRDDANPENTIKNNAPAGDAIINKYLNNVYETSGLKYTDLEYTYLYDYVFPVNNITYHVWESTDPQEPHYLYVDNVNGLLVKECEISPVSRHSKELIFKADTIVSNRSYSQQKFLSLDGKITVDLINKKITKTDSFVNNIEFPNMHIDSVGKNIRLMFFAEIGNRFDLNGYILFDVTSWGATLHITDSNVPNFEIGVYYLNSETFFLDPTIGVIGVPDATEDDKYIDDKVEESGNETKLVIREFSGKIIGYIYVDASGKKTVKEFSGKTVGYYYPDRDVTTDFYGKIIARGDASSALLFTDESR